MSFVLNFAVVQILVFGKSMKLPFLGLFELDAWQHPWALFVLSLIMGASPTVGLLGLGVGFFVATLRDRGIVATPALLYDFLLDFLFTNSTLAFSLPGGCCFLVVTVPPTQPCAGVREHRLGASDSVLWDLVLWGF